MQLNKTTMKKFFYFLIALQLLNVEATYAVASAEYSATTFNEAAANDGSITASITITLTDDTFVEGADFTGEIGRAHV